MANIDWSRVVDEVAAAVTDGLSGLAEAAREDLRKYALEIAADWVDVLRYPGIKRDLEAQARLLAEKHRIVLGATARAKLDLLRDIVLRVGGGLLAAL